MISFNGLKQLVQDGALCNLESEAQIQGSSIDVRLGNKVLVEKEPLYGTSFLISLADREPMQMEERDITGSFYDLKPGEFILAHTVESFNMPDNVSATFHLKSTSARSAIGHLLAVHIDPGFNNSVLTLELHNVSRFHTVRLHHGVRIGQILFWEHEAVPIEQSYAKCGHYNNDSTVSGVKA